MASPFKIGSIRGKKLTPKVKKIYQFAKAIVHKERGKILLDKLFKEASKVFKLNNEEIVDSIYKLIESETLQTILQEESKKRFPIHF